MDVLVWRGGALGDFLLTLPAQASLDSLGPDTRRTVLEREAFHDLACVAAGAREARDPSRGGFHELFSPTGPLRSDLRTWLERFDAVIGWVSGPTDVLTARLEAAGIEHVVLRAPFPVGDELEHVADWHVRTVCDSFPGARAVGPRKLFPNAPCPPREPRLAIHPGAGSSSKRWPAERFAALARRLCSEQGLTLELITGEADAEAREELLTALAPAKPVREWRELNLLELARELRKVSLFIGNDSGPTHLAAAVGCPTLALYGPTDPALWGARGPGPVRHLVSPTGSLNDLELETCAAGALQLLKLARTST